MSTTFKSSMREVMSNAWRFFKVTGESFADCLKRAWQVYKLAKEMKKRTVQFFYQKVNGEVIADKIKGNDTRRKNDDLFTYWDCEKEAFRSFKKFNLVKIA